MASLLVDTAVLLYEDLQLIVAFIAVVLAIQWKRTEFLAGLFFLLLFTVLDALYLSITVVLDRSIIDFSQFGFILLALISFILGMRPATKTFAAPKD